MAKSVKINFAFNLVNTVVGLLFPIITFPYITRVIMAEGIGKVNFLYSIINYITLFTAIGIPIYAVREIAKVRDNIRVRNQTTVEILLLHLGLTFIGYIIVFAFAFSINRIHQDIGLFLLLSVHLLLSTIGVLWFYQAIEDFKFITIRSLVIRLIVLICLFVFVRDKDDLYAYAVVTVLADVGNYIINFLHLRSYIKLSYIDWKTLNIKRHIKPSLKIFVLNLITSIYVNLDSVMLGFLSSDAAVGYYSAGVRLSKAMLGVVTTLGTVLLPRLSNFVALGAMDEFAKMSKKAINVVITIATPMSVGMIFIAPQLIPVFCGDSFGESILTLQILAPIITFIGLSNMTGIQILYSQGKESIVIKSTLVGALTNLTLNLLLIPSFAQYGAAAATCVAEFSVIATMLIIGRKYIPYTIFNKENLRILSFCILMCLPIIIIQRLNYSVYLLLFLEILIAAFLYIVFLIFSKNEVATIILSTIKKRNII